MLIDHFAEEMFPGRSTVRIRLEKCIINSSRRFEFKLKTFIILFLSKIIVTTIVNFLKTF